MRPIGIGEIPRRIVSSVSVSLLNPEIVAAIAPLQTCAEIQVFIEAAIHAMRKIFNDEETEGILLVDAKNAFNAMNREAALHNVQYSYPALATFVKNIYGSEAELFSYQIKTKQFCQVKERLKAVQNRWCFMQPA